MSKTIAPVAMFGYNRKDKLSKCIEALEKCELASSTKLYIFADGPKTEKGRDAVMAVQEWVRSYAETSTAFESVTTIIKEKNAGLAKSIISGVTDILNEHGKIIVVEDDLLVAPNFLSYMNDGLDFFEKDDRIWEIASYGYALKSLKNYEHDIYAGYRLSSWGWATWKDRWEQVDWNVSDYDKLKASKELQKKFCRGGGDLYPMLQAQMDGKIDSWAIRWNYAASMRDKLTIYPKHGLISNDGFDGSGIHSGLNAPKSTMENGSEKVRFEHVEPDPKITREFYLMHTDTLDKKIKRNANPKGIVKQFKKVFGKNEQQKD